MPPLSFQTRYLLAQQCQCEGCYFATFPRDRAAPTGGGGGGGASSGVAGGGCCFCPLCGGAVATSGRALRCHVAACDGRDPHVVADAAAAADAAARRASAGGGGGRARSYTASMAELVGLGGGGAQLRACDMRACGHRFWDAGDVAPRNVARLERDVGYLLGGLPLSRHGSIFVAQDSKRLQYLKALVVGPAGSPYEQGEAAAAPRIVPPR